MPDIKDFKCESGIIDYGSYLKNENQLV